MWILAELGFVAVLLFSDLFSKWAMKSFLLSQPNMNYPVFDGILEFTYVENDGASFGAFAGNMTFLIVISSVIAIGMLAFLVIRPKMPRFLRYGILTIFAGAVGNIIDRIWLGIVRDFIDYTFLSTWFNIDFAIGNIADIFCLVGVLMVIIYVFFGYKEGDFSKKPRMLRSDTIRGVNDN